MSISSVKGINLTPENDEFSTDKCIICQEDGRIRIIETSKKLNDNLLLSVNDVCLIKYHMKCYRSYVRKGDRFTNKTEKDEKTLDEGPTCSKKSKRTSYRYI